METIFIALGLALFTATLPATAENRIMTVINRPLWKGTNGGSFTRVNELDWKERTATNANVDFKWIQSDAHYVYLYDARRTLHLALSETQANWRQGHTGDFNLLARGEWQPDFQFQVEIDERFTEAQYKLLFSAVRMMADRFTTASIADCTRKNTRKVMVDSNYPVKKNTTAADSSNDDKLQLFASQTRLLESKRFPNLKINAFEANQRDSTSLGYAYNRDSVVASSDAESERDIQGNFEIYINDRVVASGTDPINYMVNYWASTIAHEMMHNLGQRHPVDDYPTDLQIVAFDNCVFRNSDFDRTRHGRFALTCGRRQ